MDETTKLIIAMALPTLSVLVGILINHRQIDMLRAHVDTRFDLLERLFDTKLQRVEEVLDARLKHLEEK